MKTIHYRFLAVFFFFMCTNTVISQIEKIYYLTATTMHRNTQNDNLSQDEWKAIEKEYFDNVTQKNELIIGSNVVSHYFTEDNTEIIFVTLYENWAALDKSWIRSQELEKLAWPDDKKRKEFFEKRSGFYDNHHSDEIYETMVGAKRMGKLADKEMIYYVRKGSFANPKDGTEKEFGELNKQFMDAVTNKNDFIKAYYPYRHAWGSNSTDFVEVYVVENLGDLEKAFAKDDELFKTQWKDEKARNDYDKKMGKYFSKTHSDFIYRSVVGLQK